MQPTKDAKVLSTKNSGNTKSKPNLFGHPAFAKRFESDIDPGEPKQDYTDLTISENAEITRKKFKSFKQVASMMTINLRWVKQGNEVQEDRSKNVITDRDNERLTFNVSGKYS